MTAQFHLAFGVRDLDEARAFYLDTLGCALGRETDNLFAGSQRRRVLPGDVGWCAGVESAVGGDCEHVQRVDGVDADRAECAVRRPIPPDHAAERGPIPRRRGSWERLTERLFS